MVILGNRLHTNGGKEERKMPAFVETFAYKAANGPAWHGLGNAVNRKMTLEEWEVAAGLNWPVERRYIHMRVNRETQDLMSIPGYVAIVRGTDKKVFQVASDRYHPVQNRQILQFFREYTEAGHMEIDTVGALKGGAIVWAQATIGKEFQLAGGDKVKARLLLATSHDGSLVTSAATVEERVVCYNTLRAALGEDTIMVRVKHSKKFTKEVEADAKEKMGIAIKQAARFQEVAQQLSEAKVDFNGNVVKEFILRLTNSDLLGDAIQGTENMQAISSGKGLLDAAISNTQLGQKFNPDKITEEDLGRVGRAVLDSILRSPGNSLASAKDTYWGVLNGITHYADHVAGRERDTALTSAWFGQKATMKSQALELAMEYAGREIN